MVTSALLRRSSDFPESNIGRRRMSRPRDKGRLNRETDERRTFFSVFPFFFYPRRRACFYFQYGDSGGTRESDFSQLC